MITLLVLAHWIAANTVAATSVLVSCTRYRGGIAALLLGGASGAYGLFLGCSQGFPRPGAYWIWIFSWLPVAAGCFTLLRWRASRPSRPGRTSRTGGAE